MEVPVYNKAIRWLMGAGMLVAFIPLIALLLRLRAVDPKVSGEFLIVIEFLAIFYTGLFLFVHVMTNVWIRIDRISRKVSQLYKLFGWSIYQRTYDLSQFDRISLHRAVRGGYRATLVGHDREVVVTASPQLGVVRRAAEQTANFSGLRLSDQL